jgi:hypothetical protein
MKRRGASARDEWARNRSPWFLSVSPSPTAAAVVPLCLSLDYYLKLYYLGTDSDRIRKDTNSDVTIYHILFRIRIRIRIQNGYFDFAFAFEYLLNL